MKVLLLFNSIFLLLISHTCISCNVVEEVISNEVIIPDRQNNILFLLSKNCSKNMYNILLNGILTLEKKTQNTFGGDEYSIFTKFGKDYKYNFTKNDKFYDSYEKTWCIESDNCYTSSLIDNPDSFLSEFVPIKKPCPEGLSKEFTVIISDTCLPKLNKELNDKNDCSMEFRKITLMLPTKDDVEKCQKEISDSSSNKLFIDLYSVDEIDSDSPKIIQSYSDMNVIYSSTMAEAKINLFLMIIEPFQYSLNYFDKLTLDNIPLCKKGSMVGYFQYRTIDEKLERVSKMTLPLNYKNDNFIPKNYMNSIKNSKYHNRNGSDCSFLKSFLSMMQSMPLKQSQEQYNVIYVNDPPPPCFSDLKLYWNDTNRHLEVLVLYSKSIRGDYSKLISLSKNSLNHISFYDQNHDGLKEFLGTSTICQSTVPTRELSEAIMVTSTTTTTEALINNIGKTTNQIWIIIGGPILTLILVVTAVAIFRYFCIKKISEKRMSKITQRTDSTSCTPAFGKYWNMFLNDKEVLIDFEKVLGKGSKSTVHKAILTTSTEIVAAKISTKNIDVKDLNVIINELNTLVILKEHPNIIQLKGWTLTGSIPVIVTEMAETNLLQFIKNYSIDKNNFDTKFYLQILYQICGALKYIHENGIIHRDIACRNILLTETRIAKLADFGLSCQIKNKNGIYKENLMQNHRFPLKWLSIEALLEGKFSEKSDIWAFGILCYEIFSNGSIPYDAMSHQEMIEFLQTGQRLEKPIHASKIIFEIMKQCWDQEPQNRSTFKEIQSKIEISLEYSYLPLKKY